jgi:hypothetical protein
LPHYRRPPSKFWAFNRQRQKAGYSLNVTLIVQLEDSPLEANHPTSLARLTKYLQFEPTARLLNEPHKIKRIYLSSRLRSSHLKPFPGPQQAGDRDQIKTDALLSILRIFEMILFPYASCANLPGAEARAVTGSGHGALFVKEGCAPCDALARKLQAAATPFDM